MTFARPNKAVVVVPSDDVVVVVVVDATTLSVHVEVEHVDVDIEVDGRAGAKPWHGTRRPASKMLLLSMNFMIIGMCSCLLVAARKNTRLEKECHREAQSHNPLNTRGQ